MPPVSVDAQGEYPKDLSDVLPGIFSGCEPFQGEEEHFIVDPDAGYVAWNLVGASGVSGIAFSIDEHPMWVYAVDGRYVEPALVHIVELVAGRRMSVLVKVDKPAKRYTVRTAVNGWNQLLNATAVMSYANTLDDPNDRTDMPYMDIAGQSTTADVVTFDERLSVPFPPVRPAQTPDQTYRLDIGRTNTSYSWKLGNNPYPVALENSSPLLYYPTMLNNGIGIISSNGTWIDLILNVATEFQPEHPIHKHSNMFHLIGYGQGVWSYSSVADALDHIPGNFNLDNPPLFDTIGTLPSNNEATWAVLRYQVVNPGAFIIHCHIQIHQTGGMLLALLDGVDAWPEIPQEYELEGGQDS